MYFKLLLYIIKNGSFWSQRKDYELKKAEKMSSLEIEFKRPSSNRVLKLLMRLPILNTFIVNFSYIKSCLLFKPKYFNLNDLHLSYLRIPKCASTSILKELLKLKLPKNSLQFLTDDQVDVLAEDFLTNNTDLSNTFTIIRNPFIRIVSVYVKIFKSSNNFFVYQNYLFGIIKLQSSFSEFVDAISKIPYGLMDTHIKPQHHFIDRNNIKVFKLESERDKLTDFLSNYGICLSHINKSQQYDYREFYDSQTLDKVANIYHGDIEIFDYMKEFILLKEYCNNKQ